MVSAVSRNKLEAVVLADLLLVLPADFERHLVRLGAAVGEEDDVFALEPFIQLLRKLDRRQMALRQRKIRHR
ncbi:hypothetical protein D3C84_1239610 [compost metagenome]